MLLNTPGFEIKHFDIISSYPSILMKESFPVGKFDILIEKQDLKEITYNVKKKQYFFKDKPLLGLVHIAFVPPIFALFAN